MNTDKKPLLAGAALLMLALLVFDPADYSHLKLPLFLLLAIIGVVRRIRHGNTRISPSLLLYVLAFSLMIPLLSITGYLLSGRSLSGFDGFVYLKSYLFLGIVLLLNVEDLDLLKPLSAILSLLS